jgi:cadmium resistance protein CadD (predicted permease)
MLSGQLSRRQIFTGYALAAAAVLVISLLLGQLSAVLPIQYIGYLGLIPIFLGLRMLLANFRSDKKVDDEKPKVGLGTVGLATTLFSNSVDTVLVLAPLLIDSQYRIDVAIGISYVFVALGWFVLGYFLHHHAARLQWITSAARWLAPLIMIAVGAYIIDNTVTDIVAGH